MKHMYLSKENHLCYKQEHLAHCSPVRIELVFERNITCILGVSGRDKLCLLHIDPLG
jgi:hypothetical protein